MNCSSGLKATLVAKVMCAALTCFTTRSVSQSMTTWSPAGHGRQAGRQAGRRVRPHRRHASESRHGVWTRAAARAGAGPERGAAAGAGRASWVCSGSGALDQKPHRQRCQDTHHRGSPPPSARRCATAQSRRWGRAPRACGCGGPCGCRRRRPAAHQHTQGGWPAMPAHAAAAGPRSCAPPHNQAKMRAWQVNTARHGHSQHHASWSPPSSRSPAPAAT